MAAGFFISLSRLSSWAASVTAVSQQRSPTIENEGCASHITSGLFDNWEGPADLTPLQRDALIS